jgi:AcrR family transcriptional regulator
VKVRKADEQQTRRRILDAATRQFVDRGYKHVTIREICKEARANVAAVNYHFGDKGELYREVLEEAFAVIKLTTERSIQEGKGKSAEEKLRAYIRVHAEVILQPTGRNTLHQLFHRESQEPELLVDELLERTFKPRFEYLFGVVGELLVLTPQDPRVRLSALSIHGLILMFRPNPITARVGAQLQLSFSTEEITEHLLAFSLSALDAYRPWRARAKAPRSRSRRAPGSV